MKLVVQRWSYNTGYMTLAPEKHAVGGRWRRGGGRSMTLVLRRRMEYDAGAEDDDRVRHWHQQGRQSMTLALRRQRMEEDAGIKEEKSGRGRWH